MNTICLNEPEALSSTNLVLSLFFCLSLSLYLSLSYVCVSLTLSLVLSLSLFLTLSLSLSVCACARAWVCADAGRLPAFQSSSLCASWVAMFTDFIAWCPPASCPKKPARHIHGLPGT